MAYEEITELSANDVDIVQKVGEAPAKKIRFSNLVKSIFNLKKADILFAAPTGLYGTDGTNTGISSKTKVQEMIAIDYTSMSEQVVPGEFFPGRDGGKKQVYTRTYILSTQLPEYRVALTSMDLSWVDTFKSVGGTLLFGKYVEAIGTINTYEGHIVSSFRAFNMGFSAYIGASDVPAGTVVNMIVTIKYTKL